jgi:hypothetical protein
MPRIESEYLQFLCKRLFSQRDVSRKVFDVAVDTEIDPETGDFILGHAFGEIGVRRRVDGKLKWVPQRVDESFKSLAEMWKFVEELKNTKDVRVKIVFFNAIFDMKYIREQCNALQRLKNGTRIIHAKTKNGVDIEDICNHVKGTLGTSVDTLKMNDPKNNLCGEAIYKTEYVKGMQHDELAQHCRWDAMATWELAMFYENMFKSLGTKKKLTMAQNAMDFFVKAFMEDENGDKYWFSRKDPRINEFIFESMRGGRVEPYERYEHEIASYDINSMYVSIMKRIEVPDPGFGGFGYPVFVEQAESDWRYYYDKYYCIVEATVDYPVCHKPMLPYYDEENDKLLFPSGVFRGTWHKPELVEAERRGCKILKCHSYLWFKKTIPLFRGYADWVWAKRMEAREKYKKGSPQEIFFKDMGNGLFGKFAQRNPYGDVLCKESEWKEIFGDRPLPPDVEPFGDGYLYRPIQGKKDSIHCFPEIAGCITTHARLMIAAVNLAIDESEEFPNMYVGIYSDTDSIKVARRDRGFITEQDLKNIAKIIDVGQELGQLKFEGVSTIYPLVPKGYFDVSGHYLDGRPFIRIKENKEEKKECGVTWKGIKKNADFEIEFVKEGNNWVPKDHVFHAEFEKPIREMESIRRGLEQNMFLLNERDGTTQDTKRVWAAEKSMPHILTSDEELTPYSDDAEKQIAEYDLPKPEPGEIVIAQVINKQELNMEMGR